MRVNHVLIDFENVQVQDLQDLNRPDFRVTIFLGSQQSKISVELATQMQALGDRGEYVQICGNGPNALDFHIAFTIGEKISGETPPYFHIISKDTGFDPLITHLKKRKLLAARYTAIAKIPLIAATHAKTTDSRTDMLIEKFTLAKQTRPKTTATLSNSIRTLFQSNISESEIEQVIKKLVTRKFITIDAQKVTYLQDPITK